MTTPTLFDYQVDLALRLAERDSSFLILGVGLGKTATVLSSIPTGTRTLVIAPKMVAKHSWPSEAALWRPDLSAALALGTPKQRAAAYAARPDILITSRDVQHEALDHGPYDLLVIDESSAYTSVGTKRYRSAMKLAKATPRRILMTGTPRPRGPLDLYGQVTLLDLGERFGTSFTRFRDRYAVPDKTAYINGRRVTTSWAVLPEKAEAVESATRELVVTTDHISELPPVHTVVRHVEMPKSARRFYNELRKEMIADHPDLTAEVFAASAGVLSLRLKQVADGIIKDAGEVHAAKLDALESLLNDELDGEQVLVQAHFIDDFARIKQRFPDARDAREEGAVDAFNSGRLRILLGHAMSVGHGVSLHKNNAKHVVWMSPTPSGELYTQLTGRLSRTGSTADRITSIVLCSAPIDHAFLDRALGRIDDEQMFVEALRDG